MIFNSVTFLVFLAIATILYWLLPRRARLWMLLICSVTFYGFWRFEFVPLMLLSSTTDYLAASGIHRTESQRIRRLLLLLSLTVNLGLLFVFKYLAFFTENVWMVLSFLGVENPPPTLSIILPLGISFYTFQTISYTIDVYRGFIKPEKDYVLYSCYVMYFPQLVAGPILRAGEVIDQLRVRPRFRVDNFVLGFRRILFGLFLKVVLADNIAPLVDTGFSFSADVLSALDVWTLAFLFGFQIYFDFSAYSHIAIGSAQLMGIDFPENFNFPYLATSPREFWRRWHISLSSWIRDYLYLPLAGATVRDESTGGLATAMGRQQINTRSFTFALFATWAIMGLWHGAAWTFVVWGLWHAVLVFLYRSSDSIRVKLPTWLRTFGGWGITLLASMLSWIPFRANGMQQTVEMLFKVASPAEYFQLGLRENTYVVAALIMILMLLSYAAGHFWDRIQNPYVRFVPETVVYAAAITLVFVFLRPIHQFIYFQF